MVEKTNGKRNMLFSNAYNSIAENTKKNAGILRPNNSKFNFQVSFALLKCFLLICIFANIGFRCVISVCCYHSTDIPLLQFASFSVWPINDRPAKEKKHD